jgi:hypothetical protein
VDRLDLGNFRIGNPVLALSSTRESPALYTVPLTDHHPAFPAEQFVEFYYNTFDADRKNLGSLYVCIRIDITPRCFHKIKEKKN